MLELSRPQNRTENVMRILVKRYAYIRFLLFSYCNNINQSTTRMLLYILFSLISKQKKILSDKA